MRKKEKIIVLDTPEIGPGVIKVINNGEKQIIYGAEEKNNKIVCSVCGGDKYTPVFFADGYNHKLSIYECECGNGIKFESFLIDKGDNDE